MKPKFPLFYRIFAFINLLGAMFIWLIVAKSESREYLKFPFLMLLSILLVGISFNWLLSTRYSRLLLFINFAIHLVVLFVMSFWFFVLLPEEERKWRYMSWVLYTVIGSIYGLFCLSSAFTKSSLEWQNTQEKPNRRSVRNFTLLPLLLLIVLLYPFIQGLQGLPLFSFDGGAPIVQTKQLENYLEETDDGERNYISYERPELETRGQTVANFVPPNFRIDLETEGYLNEDSFVDKVIVIIHLDTTAERSSLVLLQLPDRTYKLDKVSWKVVPPKYTGNGLEIYNYQEITIDSIGALRFTMQGSGPVGTLESSFKYMGDELVLTHIHTYNMGAGGHTQMEYNLLDSFLEITEINTMDENAPERISTYTPNEQKILFETSDPYEIITSATKEL